jgi:hypothetical protein
MFKDHYASRKYVVNDVSTLTLIIVSELPLLFGMVIGFIIFGTYGILAFFGYLALLIYGSLQTFHVYDYYRATH